MFLKRRFHYYFHCTLRPFAQKTILKQPQGKSSGSPKLWITRMTCDYPMRQNSIKNRQAKVTRRAKTSKKTAKLWTGKTTATWRKWTGRNQYQRTHLNVYNPARFLPVMETPNSYSTDPPVCTIKNREACMFLITDWFIGNLAFLPVRIYIII